MIQRFAAGLIASGLIVLLLKLMGMQSGSLETAQLMAWQKNPLFTLPNEPDPAAEAIMRESLQSWNAKWGEGTQGVWIQSGMTVVGSYQGTVPLPAASLTKIATTLASLDKWGPTHQFETLVSATGPVQNGVLQGDLVVTGSGDPFFVWEEAIALGNSLNQLGIRSVTGNLVIVGDFAMNYEEKTLKSAGFLLQGLNSNLWPPEAVAQYNLMPKGTAKPQVAIAGTVQVATNPVPKTTLLLRHKSLPLSDILKELNIYSNNAMSEMLTKVMGGAKERSKLAAKSANVPLEEIQLVNGSGLGVENRLSPHAVCAMLKTVEQFLQPHQLSTLDIFPVAGRDKRGTMEGRRIPVGSAVKTGTLNQVSALAGFLPTRDRGQVCFAIINGGTDVEGFRVQQDELLGRLAKHWGIVPMTDANKGEFRAQLGDPKRNVIVSGLQTQR
jgi:D-alanyl-D-alanine carboxypeptidase/D-alanyl-D-alanine-endopeptidase (penicillin-binding protein 4)